MGMEVSIKSPVEQFVYEVLPADRLDDLRGSLPAHIRPEVFQRNLLNAVMINPGLMDFSPGLLFREVSKAAALGLFLDPQLGEAYLVVAYNYKTKSNEPQLRVGYRGMVKLARQSGEIAQIYAHEVCESDLFECELGTHKDLIHKPKVFGPRGKIVGYYAVAKYRDGTADFEPMALADILAIRDRSDAWKAFKAEKIKSTPWSTDEGEMSKKTVVRRLVKRLPQSPELSEAIQIEDRAEFPNFIEDRAVQSHRRVAPPPPVPAAALPQPEPVKEPLTTGRRAPPPPPQAEPPISEIDPVELQAKFATALCAAFDEETANDAYTIVVGPHEKGLADSEVEEFLQMLRNRIGEFEP